MTTQEAYTPEEWTTVFAAPMAAGLFITAADPSGPIGLFQEAMAVSKAITDAADSSSSEVIKSIGQALKDRKKPEMPKLPKDKEQAHAALLDACKEAADIVAQKDPAEAEAFRAWLVSVSQIVAQASKEGGFLGFGGTRVSADETAAINQLSSTLGVSA
ncbi:MAG: hypothetical protein ACRDJE_01115 [Dehalococcoidia bacterium]